MTKVDEHIQEAREALLTRPNSRFVDLEEFYQLLLSRRILHRFSDPKAHVRGLVDLQSGELFLIEQDQLPGG